MRTEAQHEQRKTEVMEACFTCYSRLGLGNAGIKALAKECGMSSGSLYTYFESVDELVIQATAHCMAKVEEEFMAKAPKNAGDLERFLDEVPYWTAKKHGAKYRLMYQVYTHPKYIAQGRAFFRGVNERYARYAAELEPKLGIPRAVLTPMIFTFVRAAVHYAMFEDEFYLKAQIGLLKQSIALFQEKYHPQGAAPEGEAR